MITKLLCHVLKLVASFTILTFSSIVDRSKIFIRFPKTLFATEDALETRKHGLGEIFCVRACWF